MHTFTILIVREFYKIEKLSVKIPILCSKIWYNSEPGQCGSQRGIFMLCEYRRLDQHPKPMRPDDHRLRDLQPVRPRELLRA